MPLHRLRFYLRLALLCIAVAIADVLVWNFVWTPVPEAAQRSKVVTAQTSPIKTHHRDLPPISEIVSAVSRPLRRPLSSEATASGPVAKPAVPKLSNPTFRLVGTVMEPGLPSAILSDRLGHQEIRRVGEHVGDESGPTIIEITTDQVVLDYRGMRSTLQMERPPSIDSFREPIESSAQSEIR